MNKNLNRAKKAKNDEFYTRLEDIQEELKHYKKHFKDRVVYCNCDDPKWSAFWEYFHVNFKDLGLKKLVSTHYEGGKTTYKMEYEGGDDNNLEAGTITWLKGDGDFKSDECVEIMKECDILVTNPPFSLFRAYVQLLTEHNKDFLIIGNKNAITYKAIFPLMKDNKIWLGVTSPKEFLTPDETTKKISGLSRWFSNLHVKKIGNVGWFSNMDTKKRHKRLVLSEKYYDDNGNPRPDAEEIYPKYDNYDAIEVSRVADIPMDYYPQEMIVTEEELEQLRSAGKYVKILEELNNEEI